MTEFPDRVAAIVQTLAADPTVAGMVTPARGTSSGQPRIFADEIPDFVKSAMPTSVVVVRDAPGGDSIHPRSYMEHSDTMIDLRHYGWTFASARTLAAATLAVLRQLGNPQGSRTIYANTLIHWANKVSGPIPMRDFTSGKAGAFPLEPTARLQPAAQPLDNEKYWPFYVTSWHVYAADIPTPA